MDKDPNFLVNLKSHVKAASVKQVCFLKVNEAGKQPCNGCRVDRIPVISELLLGVKAKLQLSTGFDDL